jgi:hypothetical protein
MLGKNLRVLAHVLCRGKLLLTRQNKGNPASLHPCHRELGSHSLHEQGESHVAVVGVEGPVVERSFGE